MDGHPGIETLSAYADAELASVEVARVEHHLSACAACREQLRRVRGLVATAGGLPREMSPPDAVWTALQGRMRGQGAPTRRPWTVAWLAAAAVLVVAGTLLLQRPAVTDRGSGTPPETPAIPAALASVDRSYSPTIADLRQALQAQRSTLSPATIRVLEHSVAVIDTAIAEARAALAADPGNAALAEILSAQYEMKVDLLQRATKLSSSL